MEHHRQTDDLRAGFEVSKRGALCHGLTLRRALPALSQVSSDKVCAHNHNDRLAKPRSSHRSMRPPLAVQAKNGRDKPGHSPTGR